MNPPFCLFDAKGRKVEGVVGLTEQGLNKELTSKFIPEVLVNGSSHRTNGSGLSIELFELCSLFT